MSRNEELERLKKEYNQIKAPEEGIKKMESAIRRAKMDKKRDKRKKLIRNWGIGVAAALVIVVLPNTNENIAYAMGNIPVLGNLFRVITVREYTHNDGNNEANVEVPEVVLDDTETPENSQAVEQVNKSVREYTDQLITEFEADMTEEGHLGLDVTYETLLDTDSWFTLKVTVLETQASGYEVQRFYHIDKKSGNVVELKDLFEDRADYVTRISEEIKKQMKEQIEAGTSYYFLEDEMTENFEKIAENQNFYLDTDGNLVIVFDKYDVGPGYIGNPEFVIPSEVIEDILK